MNKRLVIQFLFIGFVLGDEFHRKAKSSDSTRPPIINVMESSRTFWRDKASNYIASVLDLKTNTNKAKNVIFFLGDGMGLSTVAATRMYKGKEEDSLSFEQFPHFGLSKTYCIDRQTADSACTAVAFLSGVKTNYRLLGLNGNILSRQCDYSEADHVDSIVGWAQKSKKATGIVTTTRITHATPAGAYAHVSHRDWEYNAAISSACRGRPNVKDIAEQLIYNEVSKNLKVILGGGRRNFINTTETDEEGRPGLRTDGRNLINEWITERNKQGKAEYIWHKQQLDEVDYNNTDYLMGLFENDHCMYHLDVLNEHLEHQEPSITDMTVAAIKMLRKEENGFFLLVEGGKIDHAHHSNRVQRALDETLEFSRAIDVARHMTDEEDTLIVVSSDHSHVFTYNGYPDRGSSILGAPEVSNEDGLPYETMSYSNGPSYPSTFNEDQTARRDISQQDMKNPTRRYSSTVPLSSETHAGEDVGVYASGPWSHLFVGSYEQNNIPVLMSFAAKIGLYAEELKADNTTERPSNSTLRPETTSTDSATVTSISAVLISIGIALTIVQPNLL
jgi:alkaline phosphatase